MEVEEIAGGFHLKTPPDPSWIRVSTQLSDNLGILVEVFRMSLGYRVLVNEKREIEFGYPAGVWWEATSSIGAASLEEAVQIARQHLGPTP